MRKLRHIEIYEHLKKGIRLGHYKFGELLPTDLEVSERFSVSRPTASRAFSLLKSEGWISRQPGRGTVVTRRPSRRLLRVGVLIPHLGRIEIFDPIAESLESFCYEEGIELFIARPDSRKSSIESIAKQQLDACLNAELDGVFFAPVEHVDGGQSLNTRILDRLIEAGIAVVLLDRDALPWPQQTSHDLVGIDNIQAGFVVANHLLDRGCNNLLFVSGAKSAMTIKLRIMGCREALIQRGFSTKQLQYLSLSQNTERSVSKILRRNVDGLICGNDATAAIVQRHLLDHGTAIPNELKMVSFDDVRFATSVDVPLSTYQQPCREIAQIAGQTMLERLEHRERAPRRIFLKGKLVVRKSS
ncbi:LacI family DNA-binding transcriptional regulator [Pelagicoccus mobilis]|uniref:LacI family DNA-binding transcriptional regulator n=1 Tax=Pelagicoccus mobilis TaxID=415221 RepID=A0A934RQZ8_9BACT|nr:LacI family DNA-binding transcriptional regulator [Pelagicoccus mobilis]MBK1875935.1 LacI family DNA-binding transcriptional regulator [Pelagicoccus mobilis]